MPLTKDAFGVTSNGEAVDRYTLQNADGVVVEVITLGGCITSVKVPDRNGVFADVTPGFSSVSDYEKNPAYFGAIIGRVANRTRAGKFSIDGQDYQLDKLWSAEVDEEGLLLSRTSPDGEERYPGALTTTARYQLTEDNQLVITFTATTSSPTIVNMTNHSYWNLAGHDRGPILDHVLQVNASRFTPKCSKWNVPNGEQAPTNGTIYDFTKPKQIGEHIGECKEDDRGYDINFCIDGNIHEKRLAARVEHPPSGRVLELFLDKPGMQLYTGGFISDLVGKGGSVYSPHSSFAIESQDFPDAANNAAFPKILLRSGETYKHGITYKFSVVH